AVAFVDCGPQRACRRLPRHADWIPKSGGEDTLTGPVRIEVQDRSALRCLARIDIRSRPHADIHLCSGAIEQNAARAVAAWRERCQSLRLGTDPRLAERVRHAQEAAGG